jgi:uncharacterized membrane protein
VRLLSLVIIASIFGVPSVFYGDALGLSRWVVVVVSVVGSMLGVTVNLLASDWIAGRLRRRAAVKGTTSRVDRISERAQPIVDQMGTVGLGLVGPILLGTFGTALVGPLVGVSRRRVFLALLLGVTVWCVVFAVASDLLVDRLAVDPNAP